MSETKEEIKALPLLSELKENIVEAKARTYRNSLFPSAIGDAIEIHTKEIEAKFRAHETGYEVVRTLLEKNAPIETYANPVMAGFLTDAILLTNLSGFHAATKMLKHMRDEATSILIERAASMHKEEGEGFTGRETGRRGGPVIPGVIT